jgi:NAD(P)-dependent dehydrogenase (short-subunit alcohol dehydrogenase family)
MGTRRTLGFAVAGALLVGAGGGYAVGAHRSSERAANCQEAAQGLYNALHGLTDLEPQAQTQAQLEFVFTDDFCPIDQVEGP